MKPKRDYTLYREIKTILYQARQTAYRSVNFAMVMAYWEIGKRIVEHEQQGRKRAGYGEFLLKDLSEKLTKDFGKGFTETNLRYMRLFYNSFPIQHAAGDKLRTHNQNAIQHAVRDESSKMTKVEIMPALRAQSQKRDALHHASAKGESVSDLLTSGVLRWELSWTHYRLLMRVENIDARNYYKNEAADNKWSTRTLERQINTFTYERILSSKNKKAIKKEADDKAEQASPLDFIKDPYVLEFLELPSNKDFFEKDLEAAIISKLQHFLLELGKGFSFVARQKRVSAEDEHAYIDLVFYNYMLKCFVLIDLKLGKLTHQDIGQMDFYVRWWEDNEKTPTDNPTIGIILCSEKNETIVKYSVLKGSKQLFASKYKLYLPTEDELKRELEYEIMQYKLQYGK